MTEPKDGKGMNGPEPRFVAIDEGTEGQNHWGHWIDNTDYVAAMAAMPETERRRLMMGDWVVQDPWPGWFGHLTGTLRVDATPERRYTCSVPLGEWAVLHVQHRRLPRTLFADIAATFYDVTDPSLMFSLDALNPNEVHLHVALQTSTKGSVSFEYNGPEPGYRPPSVRPLVVAIGQMVVCL